MRASDIELQPYASPFLKEEEKQEPDRNYSKSSAHKNFLLVISPFMSTILFFEDLCFCANDIIKKKNRLESLKLLLDNMNKILQPSFVYIPVVKGKSFLRRNILNN